MPEPIVTKWVVLTGAPSCGKTTTLEKLAALGHLSSPEAARAYFEEKLSTGSTIDELLSWDYSKLGEAIIDFEEAARAHLPKDKRVILDRVAAIESAAYADARKAAASEAIQKYWPYKYRHAQVFILDPLPVQEDAIRKESQADVLLLDQKFEEYYRKYGYDVIRVPVLPIEERVDFIVARLN